MTELSVAGQRCLAVVITEGHALLSVAEQWGPLGPQAAVKPLDLAQRGRLSVVCQCVELDRAAGAFDNRQPSRSTSSVSQSNLLSRYI